jgi:hypothetical protein
MAVLSWLCSHGCALMAALQLRFTACCPLTVGYALTAGYATLTLYGQGADAEAVNTQPMDLDPDSHSDSGAVSLFQCLLRHGVLAIAFWMPLPFHS